MNSILALFGFIAAVFVAASMGAVFKPGAWYERLAKPAWRPPNWLFAPVWTALYLMMAVAAWIVWGTAGFAGAGLALGAWFVQLTLNLVWTPVFFGLRRPDLGFVVIDALWLAIAATIALFAPVSLLAAALLVPYLAWVTFAAALNLAIWRMNPDGGASVTPSA